MRNCFDFESNEVEYFILDLFDLDLLIPYFYINQQRVGETFHIVQNKVLIIFNYSLLWFNGDYFELCGNIMIGELVFLLEYFLESEKPLVRLRFFFLYYSFRRLFRIKPSILAIEALSKDITLSLFKLNSILGNTYFRLYLILLNDSCDHVWPNMLIFKSGIDLIKSVWGYRTKRLSSWHFFNIILLESF